MDSDTQEYHTIILAGLLHDIGKLLQRGKFGSLDITGKHPVVSARFINTFEDCFHEVCDVPLIKTLVQKHHESHNFESDLNINSISDEHIRTLARLVSKADNLSSAERLEPSTEYRDYKDTPLASVLERIKNEGAGAPTVRFHPKSLSTPEELRSIFPADFRAYAEGELNDFLQDFGKDFGKIFRSGPSVVDRNSFQCVVTHLYSLLAKHAWCIPSNTQEVRPDVSLFDHLRTTAAIASCLYLYHSSNNSLNEKAVRSSDEKQFILVGGDLSGIQNYIFDISTAGAGGIARRLRARSLYVQLCSEVSSHLILRKLGLSIPIHTLMNSGGHFYLLLPNTDTVAHMIPEVQKEMDNWFVKELNGELALNLALVPFGDDGFQSEENVAQFGTVLKDVNARLDKRKKRRFAGVLQNQNQWQEAAFEIPLVYHGEESCQSCRKFPQARENLCFHCYLDREIGKNLPAARYLAFYPEANIGEIPVFGYSVSFVPQGAATTPYLVAKINDTNLFDLTSYPAVFKYLARTVPAEDNCKICQQEKSPIATFECLAKRAEGDALVGFLKMDVDDLGETVIFGLKPNDSISRVSTFSRMFDIFFAGYVESLAQREKSIYTIFSGGDDLFLVGPWDLILETVEYIRNDFRIYANNPNITVSAGVAINGHNYPISMAAAEAKTALDASKNREGKDCITVLGNTLTWSEWGRIAEEWADLREIVKEERVPTAFLYNLLAFGEMWAQFREGDVLGLRYHPLLAYSLRRNVSARTAPELIKWTNTLLSIKPGNKDQLFLLNGLPLLSQLLILSKRRKENDER